MEEGMLYLVSTPIGNLKDITLRALETLKEADEIYCEDTRHSQVLLSAYDIRKPLFSLHKFNEARRGEEIARKVREGKKIACISDAGMPGISDPGEGLVRLFRAEGLPLTVLPGPNAALTALVLSGFSCQPFVFLGFLPEKKKDRAALLERWRRAPGTLIFYAAPHDVERDFRDLAEALGDRRAAAVREISKLHESVSLGTLKQPRLDAVRGEFVLVVEGAAEEENPRCALTPAEHVAALEAEGLSRAEAVKQAARERKVPKNQVYQAVLGRNGDE